jgi:hypothetical protein
MDSRQVIKIHVCSMEEEWSYSAIWITAVPYFGPDQAKIDEFIKELKDSGMTLTMEDDVYAFLEVEVKTSKETGRVTLNQSGLTRKVLRSTGMQDSNRKHTPANTMPLGTDADRELFHEDWDYALVVGMLMYV